MIKLVVFNLLLVHTAISLYLLNKTLYTWNTLKPAILKNGWDERKDYPLSNMKTVAWYFVPWFNVVLAYGNVAIMGQQAKSDSKGRSYILTVQYAVGPFIYSMNYDPNWIDNN